MNRTLVAMLVCLPLLGLGPPVHADAGPVIAFDRTGAAGDWFVLNVPFVEPLASIGGHHEVELVATAPADRGGHLIFYPPTWLQAGFGIASIGNSPPYLVVLEPGESFRFGYSEPFGASGDALVSIRAVVAADVPWTFAMRMAFDATDVVLGVPALDVGQDTTVHAVEGFPAGSVAPGGLIRADGVFARAGWHHVHVQRVYVEPVGARTYDIQLPTEQWDGVGVAAGLFLPPVFLLSVSGWMVDAAGALVDDAGAYSVEITYADAAWDLQVYVFEMPGRVTLAEGWTSAYNGTSGLPAWQCFSPTCVPTPDL